jgi:catechol 2,3-dioxygenase-like lactoylglutathione lyase family enzyme
MAVSGVIGIALQVPDLDAGTRFYTDAGLDAVATPDRVSLTCSGSLVPSVTLSQSQGPMRLHHVVLRADALAEIAALVPQHGGRLVTAPAGHDADGLWVEDPHGVLFHLVDVEKPLETAVEQPFAINAPGHIVRNRRSAMLPVGRTTPARPRRLGHVALFSPDVMASVAFVTQAFGMGLADHVDDIIAFCCARRDSDHHVLAFAKSPGTGLHHTSFQVADPDEVGRAGHALAEKAGKGHWGFGRHTIGSNFFQYIQDPWGSWFEYYSDMDFIDDYALWQPTNYAMEDAMANWAPPVPADFVHNYQAEEPA